MRLIIALLASCLVASSPAIHASAPSASPDPSASFGGRVDAPRHGVAVTFPEHWLAFDLGDDLRARVADIEAGLGDALPVAQDALVADLERRRASCVLLGLSLDRQACELSVVPSSPVDLSDPAFQAALDAAIRAEQGIVDFTGLASVEIPAGPAVTYGWVQVHAGPEGQDLPHASYMVDGGDIGVVLTCEGTWRPEDDWLSIAQTIEFFPQLTPVVPIRADGRDTVHEDGVWPTSPDDGPGGASLDG